MPKRIPSPLVTFEMANNHMGDLAHGLRIIREFSAVSREFPEFSFAMKFQYRDLDSFIHPSMRGRDDVKYIKRFSETRLSREQFDALVAETRSQGLLTMSTPFDEASVEVIADQRLDIIKVASCSFGDWPLVERIAKTDLPIIASTAGARVETLDNMVSFLRHREKEFAILHCVAEYPAPDEHMQLGQIDFLRRRYPGLRVGFSTHEHPEHADLVALAVAKGADIFEKHVAVATPEYPANGYSATPEQVRRWLTSARRAFAICGDPTRRAPVNQAEQDSLRSLRRGAFAKRRIEPGETLNDADVYFAFPPEPDQVTANEWGKYSRFVARTPIPGDAAITRANVDHSDRRAKVIEIASRVRELLRSSRISVPGGVELEISHHYGLDRFDEVGLTMFTIVNRGYCKKLLVSLAGQRHPEQMHKQKEETFHVLFGDVELTLNGQSRHCREGDVIHIEPGVKHAFASSGGAIIEEISSTHIADDSYYTDESINQNRDRKTRLMYWLN